MDDRKNVEKLGLKELIAMGVGGMVGGGIFSVLGLSVALSGHAAPIAFALGGFIALLTGFSYSRLGLFYHSAGGSFTYLEHAFRHKNISGVGGWLLLAGYIGTLALYAYTFGVYGTAMFGETTHGPAMHHLLESLVLLLFLGINLYGVKAAGETEDVIVIIKVLILSLFAVAGLFYVKSDYLLPVFNLGKTGVLMGAALIFVAYEGFELIPNAVNEIENPEQDLGKAIVISIGITMAVYILVSLVAVGNLLPSEISKYKEYALAIAAKPFLGKSGFMLIGLGALLSTASAINATLFGTARLSMVMAQESALPEVFSHKERTKEIPYISLISITFLALLFVNTTDLTIISSFASSTFLLIFAAINLSAVRLRKKIGIRLAIPLTGMISALISWGVLCSYLYKTNLTALEWIGGLYLCVIISELLFSERRLFFKPVNKMDS